MTIYVLRGEATWNAYSEIGLPLWRYRPDIAQQRIATYLATGHTITYGDDA
jgi:hypothetical protein